MAVVIDTETALSTAANTKTADLVSGQYEFVGKGKFTLAALGSATGMNVELRVGDGSSDLSAYLRSQFQILLCIRTRSNGNEMQNAYYFSTGY